MKITNGDLRMLRYFWEEKGDVKKWVYYKEKERTLAEEYPQLYYAIHNHNNAAKVLTVMLKEAVEISDNEDEWNRYD